MNIVERVTTIGCSRRIPMNTPLNAPTAIPIAMPMAVHCRTEACVSAPLMVVASTALTRETTAPAERSNPPDRMTSVCPIAVSARGVELFAKLDTPK